MLPHSSQQSLSVDVKFAAIPITISTSALTELAWILGGFSVGSGDKEGAGKGNNTAGARGATAQRRGSETGNATRTRSGLPSTGVPRRSPSPLMPVKVIYRRPSKVTNKYVLRMRQCVCVSACYMFSQIWRSMADGCIVRNHIAFPPCVCVCTRVCVGCCLSRCVFLFLCEGRACSLWNVQLRRMAPRGGDVAVKHCARQ